LRKKASPLAVKKPAILILATGKRCQSKNIVKKYKKYVRVSVAIT
jgi:hypothetical protein